MITKTNQLLLISSAIVASMSVTTVSRAADLTASDTTPAVYFDDTSTANDGREWGFAGRDEFFGLYDYSSSSYVLNINPSPTSSNSFNITSSGDINLGNGSAFIDRSIRSMGLGTTIPTAKLHVVGDIKTTFSGPNPTGLVELLKMSANNTTAGQFSDAGFSMENAKAGFSWAFRTQENTGGFAASKQGTGAKEFEIRNTTTVASLVELHLANGASNVGGQWLNASSRSYKKNINELSSEDAMQALKGLQSVTYEFKRDKENTQRVGFIAEDVPSLLATKDKKTVDSLQIISVLTKVAQLQNEALQVQEKSLQETKSDVKAKDAKIAEMESKIAKLILMQESLAKTVQARFTPFAAKSLKVNQQITALNR